MYLPYDFERAPTVGADKRVNGDRILFGPVKVPRPADAGVGADAEPVQELEFDQTSGW